MPFHPSNYICMILQMRSVDLSEMIYIVRIILYMLENNAIEILVALLEIRTTRCHFVSCMCRFLGTKERGKRKLTIQDPFQI